VVDTIRWAPDGERIVFNTFVSGVAFGAPLADLWTVSLEGTLRQVLSQYAAGALSLFDDGRVLVAGSTELFLTDLDGSFRTSLLTYGQILTYSEYIYYPQPQIDNGGLRAFVAIPTEDPLAADAATDLYVVETDGSLTALRRLVGSGFTLADEVVWSHNGNQIAYVRTAPDENATALFIGDESGSFVQYGANGVALDFFDWSPDGTTFLYSDRDGSQTAEEINLVIGGLGVRPLTLFPAIGVIDNARFISDTQFLLVVLQKGPRSLYIGNVSGDLAPLVTVTADGTVPIDVYLP
jgi:Tol biopolymer transport system component